MSNAALCEQFAAAGYIVVTLDAPRDAPAVVFTDGTLIDGVPNSDDGYIWPRVADVRFLLDHLGGLNGLVGALDVVRIGMFGHSRGGYLSNICAVEDARIRAAVNMDGFLWGLWTKGTGLTKFSQDFQARAHALRTPVLRRLGDQGGEERTRGKVDEEKQDFGGDFISIAIEGTNHGGFGTPWMNGTAKDFARNVASVPDHGRSALVRGLLADFFETYVLKQKSEMALLAAPPAGLSVSSRC